MKKSLLLILCLIFLLTGCSSRVNSKIYKPLSEQQLSDFLKQNNISPLAVRIIDRSTVILYQNADKMEYYSISSNDRGKFLYFEGQMFNNLLTPVSSYFISADYPFVVMIINNSEIQTNGYKVEIELSNGDFIYEFVQGKKGLIIPYKKTFFKSLVIDSVIITDKKGNVLYKKLNSYF